MDLNIMIEEIGLSGNVCLPKCSRSTAYRWARRCNDYLNHNHFDWSVRLDTTDPRSYMLQKVTR